MHRQHALLQGEGHRQSEGADLSDMVALLTDSSGMRDLDLNTRLDGHGGAPSACDEEASRGP